MAEGWRLIRIMLESVEEISFLKYEIFVQKSYLDQLFIKLIQLNILEYGAQILITSENG